MGYAPRAPGFNPTLVRLALKLNTQNLASQSGFNPTLVRLALPPLPRKFCYPRSGFNPTLVRLAPKASRPARIAKTSFNPTLVRLAPGAALRLRRQSGEFQSHLGSISTTPSVGTEDRQSHVSIPPWFD